MRPVVDIRQYFELHSLPVLDTTVFRGWPPFLRAGQWLWKTRPFTISHDKGPMRPGRSLVDG